MPLDLISSEPPPELQEAIERIEHDTWELKARMTARQVRARLDTLERIRDRLSRIIERAGSYR